jgi:hypothetical protein
MKENKEIRTWERIAAIVALIAALAAAIAISLAVR